MKFAMLLLAIWMLAGTATANEAIPNYASARAICQRVANDMTGMKYKQEVTFHPASPKLQQRLQEMRWNGFKDEGYAEVIIDGQDAILEMQSTGVSLSVFDVVRVRPLAHDNDIVNASDPIVPNSASNDDDVLRAGYGGSSAIRVIDGRVVIVTGGPKSALVQTYTSSGRALLCTINSPKSKTVIKFSMNDRLCKAALNGEMKHVATTPIELDRNEAYKWGLSGVDDAYAANFVHGASGLRIGHIHYASGAGSGADMHYLLQLDSKNHIVDSQLTRTLLDVGDLPKPPGRRNAAYYANVQIISHGGQVILKMNDGSKTSVFRAKLGHATKMCEFQELPESKIARMLVD